MLRQERGVEMETELRRAVAHGKEFLVYYQPAVSLQTGCLAGFEALVRMRGPDGRLVPQDEFIPLTEETGLIVSIGLQMLTQTVLMAHAEAAAAVLEQLHARGIKLLMDDFGTGYSSLSCLCRFPIDTLKIVARPLW